MYFELATSNCSRLARVMPSTASDMRVTGLPPTSLMVAKAEELLQKDVPVYRIGDLLLVASERISMTPAGNTFPDNMWNSHLVAQTTVEGFNCDFKSFPDATAGAPRNIANAIRGLELFQAMYLSMHVVSSVSLNSSKCTCPGFHSKSVCKHIALKDVVERRGMSLGVNLGSYPIPLQAAKYYMGITQTGKRIIAKPMLQDTPKKHHRTKHPLALEDATGVGPSTAALASGPTLDVAEISSSIPVGGASSSTSDVIQGPYIYGAPIYRGALI